MCRAQGERSETEHGLGERPRRDGPLSGQQVLQGVLDETSHGDFVSENHFQQGGEAVRSIAAGINLEWRLVTVVYARCDFARLRWRA